MFVLLCWFGAYGVCSEGGTAYTCREDATGRLISSVFLLEHDASGEAARPKATAADKVAVGLGPEAQAEVLGADVMRRAGMFGAATTAARVEDPATAGWTRHMYVGMFGGIWTLLTLLPPVPCAPAMSLCCCVYIYESAGLVCYAVVYCAGTHPDFQQRGIGAAVLSFLNAEADALGLPVFLYTANTRNVVSAQCYYYATKLASSWLATRIILDVSW
jgi:GNAT superfamily N-acetyltransferase